MEDPECYMSSYEIRDLQTGFTRAGTSKYRDVVPLKPREEVLYDSLHAVNKDRQTFYCVSVPGEAPWVAEAWKREAADARGPAEAIAGRSQQDNK